MTFRTCLRHLIAAGTLLWLATPAAVADASISSEEIRGRARSILDHPSYQTDFSDRAQGGGGGSADGGRTPNGRSPDDDPQRWRRTDDRQPWGEGASRPIPDPRRRHGRVGLPGADVIVWIVLVALVVGAAVWLLVTSSAERRRRVTLPPPASDEPPPPAPMPASRPPSEDEIEALVRRGAYGEAVHLLLRRAIRLLEKRGPLAASLTSRELLTKVELAPPSHGALAELVAAVERFLFGGVTLGRAEYERCAAAYRTALALPDRPEGGR